MIQVSNTANMSIFMSNESKEIQTANEAAWLRSQKRDDAKFKSAVETILSDLPSLTEQEFDQLANQIELNAPTESAGYLGLRMLAKHWVKSLG